MLFNTLDYFIFLPVVLVAFRLLPNRYRWGLLLAASYFFYMYWRVEYAILIILSTVVDYSAARIIGEPRSPACDAGRC